MLRPQDDHALRPLQVGLDEFVEELAGAYLQVPPDLVALGSQRMDQGLDPPAVLLRVTDKDISHAATYPSPLFSYPAGIACLTRGELAMLVNSTGMALPGERGQVLTCAFKGHGSRPDPISVSLSALRGLLRNFQPGRFTRISFPANVPSAVIAR